MPVDVNRLPRISLFDGLSPAQLAVIAQHSRQRTYTRSGEAIVHEGEQGQTCYVIIQGTVKISTTLATGDEVFLALLATGDTFGEMSLIDSGGRSADVLTLEETTLLSIDRMAFDQMMTTVIFTRNLMKILARRLRLANVRIQALNTLDVPGKVAYQIMEFAELYGETQPDGSLYIPVRLTQTDIGNLIGATRERVNQVMSPLVKSGLISIDSRYRLTVHKPVELKKRTQ